MVQARCGYVGGVLRTGDEHGRWATNQDFPRSATALMALMEGPGLWAMSTVGTIGSPLSLRDDNINKQRSVPMMTELAHREPGWLLEGAFRSVTESKMYSMDNPD